MQRESFATAFIVQLDRLRTLCEVETTMESAEGSVGIVNVVIIQSGRGEHHARSRARTPDKILYAATFVSWGDI